MSSVISPPRTPKDKSHRKHKDRSEKKSSKKRRREELVNETPEPSRILVPQTPGPPQSSPAKKRRITERQASPAIASSSRASASTLRARTITKGPTPSTYIQAASLYLPLSPVCQKYPLEGLCAEHLSPLVLTYYPPVKGVVLSYSNVRLSEEPDAAEPAGPALAVSINEYAANFVWVTADFTVFRPLRGVELEGWVNLQNESHLGLIVWNLFSASVERKRLPQDWSWMEDSGNNVDAMDVDGEEEVHLESKAQRSGEGHFVDADGSKIDGMIKFRVKDFDVPPANEGERAFISIEGTLLGADEERRFVEEEAQQRSGQRRTNGVVVATRPRPTLKPTSSREEAEEPAAAGTEKPAAAGAEKAKKSKKKRTEKT